MKTLNQWFDEYAESHQNKTNQLIHYFCVPIITFSLIGLWMCIPNAFLENLFKLGNPYIENWGAIIVAFLLLFYLRLSLSMFFKMLIFTTICIIGNYNLGQIIPLFYASLVIFVIAWIGQFYGHKLEGKKPSLFKDLQFLLIGSAWVIHKITTKK